MTNFLNFSVNTGISFSTSRNPNAVSCGDDFADWVGDVAKGEYDSVVSVENIGACIELLEDGSYWNNSDVSSEALEAIHAFLSAL